MKKYKLSLILILAFSLLISCNPTHLHYIGLEEYCQNQGAYSENHIASELFLTVDFVNKYAYIDGNFIYDYKGSMYFSELDRAFAWLTYGEDEYKKAKQDCIHEGMEAVNEGQSALGFTFYLRKNWNFPKYFTAVGYNDERKTLIFIGFCCTDEAEEENIQCAETDFGAFLTHYYGNWYDW